MRSPAFFAKRIFCFGAETPSHFCAAIHFFFIAIMRCGIDRRKPIWRRIPILARTRIFDTHRQYITGRSAIIPKHSLLKKCHFAHLHFGAETHFSISRRFDSGPNAVNQYGNEFRFSRETHFRYSAIANFGLNRHKSKPHLLKTLPPRPFHFGARFLVLRGNAFSACPGNAFRQEAR